MISGANTVRVAIQDSVSAVLALYKRSGLRVCQETDWHEAAKSAAHGRTTDENRVRYIETYEIAAAHLVSKLHGFN